MKQCDRGSKKITKTSTRHICLLAWTFPPATGGGVFRPISIARYLGSYDWELTVICSPGLANGENDEYLEGSLPENVQILRLREAPIKPSSKIFPSIDGGFINVLNTISQAVALFKGLSPSVIMASGPPFHNFLVGYYLSRYFHSRLVLDYRDDWSGFKLPFVDAGRFDRFWEKRCLEATDSVFFTTNSRLAYHSRIFPFLKREKCHVVRNGWDPKDFAVARNEASWIADEKKFVLAFVGKLTTYSFNQSFFNCLDLVFKRRTDFLNIISLHFVGSSSINIFKLLCGFNWSNEVITVHDYVSKPIANRLMMDASALLIINNPILSGWLPGKLYDYLAAGPPILVYGCGGEIQKLVTSLNAGITVPMDDAAALERAIEKLLTLKNSNAKNSIREEWLKQNTRERMVEKMAKIFDSLIEFDPIDSTPR